MPTSPWFDYAEQARQSQRRAIVVGAGIAGTAVAHALARRKWQITLIERNPAPAMGASGNPGGVVMPTISRDPTPSSQFSYNAFRFALEYFWQLQKRVELQVFHPVGVVLLMENAIQHEQLLEQYKEILACRLSPAKLPNTIARSPLYAAVFFPTAGWGNAVALCKAQIASQSDRIQVLHGHEAIHLQADKDGWAVYDRKEILANAPVVVVANGTDINRFTQTSWVEVTPARGQVSYLSRQACNDEVNNVICGEKGYVIPDQRDTVTIGATYRRNELSTVVTTRDHKINLRNIESINILKSSSIDMIEGGRAAVRATSPDHMPLLGGVPDIERVRRDQYNSKLGSENASVSPLSYYPGLYISGNYGSRGITLCPYSGELLARLICDELTPRDRKTLALLHPSRFVLERMDSRRESVVTAI